MLDNYQNIKLQPYIGYHTMDLMMGDDKMRFLYYLFEYEAFGNPAIFVYDDRFTRTNWCYFRFLQAGGKPKYYYEKVLGVRI